MNTPKGVSEYSFFQKFHSEDCLLWKTAVLRSFPHHYLFCFQNCNYLIWHVQCHCYPFFQAEDSFYADLFSHALPVLAPRRKGTFGSFSGEFIPGMRTVFGLGLFKVAKCTLKKVELIATKWWSYFRCSVRLICVDWPPWCALCVNERELK